MTQPTPPPFDLAAELARIDRRRAEFASLAGRPVDWAAPIDLSAELARIDAARAEAAQSQAGPMQPQDAPGIGSWCERHAVGIALACSAAGGALAVGAGMAVARRFPGSGADMDPALAAIGLGVFILLLARR